MKKIKGILDMRRMMRKLDELEYKTFENWFNKRPLKHPDIAITASLARNVARLVYRREQEIQKEKDRWQDERSRMAKKLFENGVKSW